MTDTILYYKTKVNKDNYVFANRYNIHEKLKISERNEQFIEWKDDTKFNIGLLLEANRKMINHEKIN